MEQNLYTRSVTEYCERVGDHFFAEPVNAFTNFAFFIVAALIFREFKRQQIGEKSYWTLLLLAVSIGTGSFLWHTLATPFAHALDAIPIWIFFLIFLYQLFIKLTQSKRKSIAAILGFALIQVTVTLLFPDVLNGSIRHLANGVIFAGVGIWFYQKFQYLSRNLVLAFSLYLTAVFFRTIDAWSCSYIPLGTHFLWHVLNACAVYFAMRLLLEMKK